MPQSAHPGGAGVVVTRDGLANQASSGAAESRVPAQWSEFNSKDAWTAIAKAVQSAQSSMRVRTRAAHRDAIAVTVAVG